MMNSLDLNLASRPIRNNTLLWVGHGTLAVLLIGFSAWNTSTYVHHRAELKLLGNERDSFESRMADFDRRDTEAQVRCSPDPRGQAKRRAFRRYRRGCRVLAA